MAPDTLEREVVNYNEGNLIQVPGAAEAGVALGHSREEEVASGLMGEGREGAQCEGRPGTPVWGKRERRN